MEISQLVSEVHKEIGAWQIAARRWRVLAKRLMASERIRFRGIVGGAVWERDVIVAPTQKWRRMVSRDSELATWSVAQHGPLTLALSPPPVVFVATSDLD